MLVTLDPIKKKRKKKLACILSACKAVNLVVSLSKTIWAFAVVATSMQSQTGMFFLAGGASMLVLIKNEKHK